MPRTAARIQVILMRDETIRRMLGLLGCAALLGAPSLSTAGDAPQSFHWPEGKRVAVSLSFDDARASQIDVGLSLFERHGAKVTFYVNPPNMKSRLEGWKKAAAEGFEIANHTTSHPCSGNFPWSRDKALEGMTPAQIGDEMDSANAQIQSMLGVKAVTFAYPCGQKFIGRGEGTQSYVPLVAKRFLAGRGFRDEAANDPVYCDLAQLFGVQSDGMSFEEMKAAVAEAAKTGAWLVFAGHEIGAEGYQTTRVPALEKFLDYAKDPANGVWLDTMEKVARYVREQRGGR